MQDLDFKLHKPIYDFLHERTMHSFQIYLRAYAQVKKRPANIAAHYSLCQADAYLRMFG